MADHRRWLTRRERQALELVGRGLSSAEIARQQGLSVRTVDSSIASAMRRLGAATRIQAAAALGDLGRLSEATEVGEDHRGRAGTLNPEQRLLLTELGAGRTVTQAARNVGLSRRSATRRLQELRSTYGVASTAQLVLVATTRSAMAGEPRSSLSSTHLADARSGADCGTGDRPIAV